MRLLLKTYQGNRTAKVLYQFPKYKAFEIQTKRITWEQACAPFGILRKQEEIIGFSAYR